MMSFIPLVMVLRRELVAHCQQPCVASVLTADLEPPNARTVTRFSVTAVLLSMSCQFIPKIIMLQNSPMMSYLQLLVSSPFHHLILALAASTMGMFLAVVHPRCVTHTRMMLVCTARAVRFLSAQNVQCEITQGTLWYSCQTTCRSAELSVRS